MDGGNAGNAGAIFSAVLIKEICSARHFVAVAGYFLRRQKVTKKRSPQSCPLRGFPRASVCSGVRRRHIPVPRRTLAILGSPAMRPVPHSLAGLGGD
jgi:hypothetical protein